MRFFFDMPNSFNTPEAPNIEKLCFLGDFYFCIFPHDFLSFSSYFPIFSCGGSPRPANHCKSTFRQPLGLDPRTSEKVLAVMGPRPATQEKIIPENAPRHATRTNFQIVLESTCGPNVGTQTQKNPEFELEGYMWPHRGDPDAKNPEFELKG